MKHRIRFKKNGPQKEYFDDDHSKYLHFSGGFGSGKTYGLCMKLLKLSYLNKDLPGGLVVPSFPEFSKDVLPTMEEILDDNKVRYRYHKNMHYFTFPWSKGKLYVTTAEKKIRGPNWAYAGINELTLIKFVRYKEVLGRVRVKKAKFPQVVSNGTPEGIASPYYEFFVEKPKPTAHIIYADTRANAHNLQDDYIATLEESYDPIMLDAYLKGLWVNMTGNRFYYSYEPHRNDDKTLVEDENQVVHVSMDFNINPMTAVIWQKDGNEMHAIDEITLGGTQGANTKNMCDALKARGYHPDRTIIYPDPAGKARSTKGPSDITILQNEGFIQIRVRNAAPRFRHRQLNTNNLLSKGILVINPDKCPKLKKDLIGVEQDPITMEKLKDNPELTHYSDGLDYMCDILFPLSGTKPDSRQSKIR